MQILNMLLEISIYATILFGITMLLKRLLRDKLSAFLHYAIWSLFLLRLLLPITLESPIQFFTIPAESAAASAPVTQPETETTLAQSAVEPATALPQVEAERVPISTQTAPREIGIVADATQQPGSLATILLIVWLAGVAFGIGYIAYLYIRLQRRIAKNAARPAKRLRALYRDVRMELGVRKNVPLVCQYGLNSPGILFPARVLMPMELLSAMEDEQIKSTLRHELVHYKRGDHIVSVLLSLLNAVYWFNPIVWIAVRQIRADMETVCDSVVVQSMNAKQKSDYANLILDLFSRSNYRKVVLGMAYGKSKAVIEKRIRGVFMKNRSQSSAKLVCFLLSFVMLVGCFTTACVPAKQDSNNISSSGNVEAQALAANPSSATPDPTPTPAPDVISPLAEKLGIPVPWRFAEWSADRELLLNGNLSITLPNVDAIPIASVTCRDVKMDDLMNTVHAFFGNDVSFIYAPEDTKEFAEESLPLIQKIYDGIQNGTNANKDPKYEKAVKDQLDTYLEMIQSAPSAAEKRPVAVEFVEGTNDYGDPRMHFQGVAERNGTQYLVRASYSATASAININELAENRPLYYQGSRRSEPVGVSMPKEQAIALATEMAGKLDSGLALSHVMTVGLFVNQGEESTGAHPWAWQCVFMREVNGVGTVYDSRDIASDMETTLTNVRVNEALEITVDDSGIINIHWVNPMTVDAITNPDATLLPFSEIEAKLADLVREKYDYDITREDGTHELFIQHAELGLMRIGKPNAKTFTLEPVWSFFIGFEETPDYSSMPDILRAMYNGDPEFWNSLTISAIDGHVIDRDRGY